MKKFTPRQAEALWAAIELGGAWWGNPGRSTGGAYFRMCERLRDQGLLDSPPFGITPRGREAYWAQAQRPDMPDGLTAVRWRLEGSEITIAGTLGAYLDAHGGWAGRDVLPLLTALRFHERTSHSHEGVRHILERWSPRRDRIARETAGRRAWAGLPADPITIPPVDPTVDLAAGPDVTVLYGPAASRSRILAALRAGRAACFQFAAKAPPGIEAAHTKDLRLIDAVIRDLEAS